jgi:pimeloyl-ACP methyl ester carboxylesterase
MQIDEGLEQIATATLVMTGAGDLSTPPVCGEHIANHIVGAQLWELPCAHLPMSEMPSQWADAVLRFLNQDPVSTPSGGSLNAES